MTADQDQTQTRRRHLGRVVEGVTCACDRDRMCLWHYDELDPGRQTRERARADVREPYTGGRRH